MLGRKATEIEGRPIAEIMGDEGFATIRPFIDKVLAASSARLAGPRCVTVERQCVAVEVAGSRSSPYTVSWSGSPRLVVGLSGAAGRDNDVPICPSCQRLLSFISTAALSE
jgi:hypothetical protein